MVFQAIEENSTQSLALGNLVHDTEAHTKTVVLRAISLVRGYLGLDRRKKPLHQSTLWKIYLFSGFGQIL